MNALTRAALAVNILHETTNAGTKGARLISKTSSGGIDVLDRGAVADQLAGRVVAEGRCDVVVGVLAGGRAIDVIEVTTQESRWPRAGLPCLETGV